MVVLNGGDCTADQGRVAVVSRWDSQAGFGQSAAELREREGERERGGDPKSYNSNYGDPKHVPLLVENPYIPIYTLTNPKTLHPKPFTRNPLHPSPEAPKP